MQIFNLNMSKEDGVGVCRFYGCLGGGILMCLMCYVGGGVWRER